MSRRRKAATKPNERRAPPVAGPHRFHELIGLVLILLATVVVYLPAMHGGMLMDDDANITRPNMQSIDGLFQIWFVPSATAQYYPLVHTAFWLEHKLWGDATLGYHLVTLLWHVLAVVLVYFILRKLKVPGALLAAAIFALHPVMVESVAYMAEQKNTLSTVFYLAAMLLYLDFDESGRRSRYWMAFGVFALALLTKSVTVTLPVALLIILWWQRGTLSWNPDVRPLLPFFALSVISGLITVWVEQTYFQTGEPGFALTPIQRLLLAGRALWFYISKLAWPADLSFVYPHWTIDPVQPWQWIFTVAALATTCALWNMRHRWRAPLAAWLFYCGTLFPALGFVNVFLFTITFVADHIQYLASLGMIVLAAVSVARLLARSPQAARRAGTALCVVLVGALAMLTWRQSSLYGDVIKLYQATLDRDPNCWIAHNNLGYALQSTDKPAAIEHIQTAIRIKPDFASAHNNLGLLWSSIGKEQAAIEEFRTAIRIRPNFPDAHSNLGILLTNDGRLNEGIDELRAALALRPDHAEALVNLGIALNKAGRLPETISQLQKALARNPNDPIALNSLGSALLDAGRTAEGIECLRRALQIKPDYAEAHNNLAAAYSDSGRLPDAIAEFNLALKSSPDYPVALNNLGLALLRSGRPADAIAPLERALRLQPDYAQAHTNLGAALAGVNKTSLAIEHFRRAAELDSDDADAHNNLGVLLAGVGDRIQAIAHLEQAARISPDRADIHKSLGDVLQQEGRPQQAIEQYHVAIRLQPDFVDAHASLAKALAQANRSQEAIAAAEKAIEVARSARQQSAIDQIESWLTHYRTQLPSAAGAGTSSEPPSRALEQKQTQ